MIPSTTSAGASPANPSSLPPSPREPRTPVYKMSPKTMRLVVKTRETARFQRQLSRENGRMKKVVAYTFSVTEEDCKDPEQVNVPLPLRPSSSSGRSISDLFPPEEDPTLDESDEKDEESEDSCAEVTLSLAHLSLNPSMKAIDLADQNFGALPSDFSSLQNLTKLCLDRNLFPSIPKVLASLPSLEELSMRENTLGGEQTFSQGEFPRLKSLDLSENYLGAVPKGIGFLTALQYLALEHDGIHEVSCQIRYLVDLKTLILDDNDLGSLSLEIGCLTSLVILSARNNRIREVPEQLYKCTKIQKVDLSSNQIDKLPKGIEQLSCIRELFLSINPICANHQECENLRAALQFRLSDQIEPLTLSL